jgi:RND family efflux transporter MFP subunit
VSASRQKPARAIALLAIALVAAGFGIFFIFNPRAKEVETYTVVLGPADRVLAVNGRMRPRLQVDIRPPVGGALVALPFNVGQPVNQGDVLARIDDAPEVAAISVAQAAARGAQVNLAQARRDLARYEALGEFAATRDVEQKLLAVEAGERELSRLNAAVIQTKELRERRVLRAPFAGVILERLVDPGQAVSPESVIYRLADLSGSESTAEVDELYAAEIRPGLEALVRLPGRTDALRAKVLHIEPRVDPTTGARDVRLALEGDAHDPPAGLTVTINFLIEHRANALSIARSATTQLGGKAVVRVVGSDGIVRERVITFVEWPAERVIVTDGIEAGERILTNPAAANPGEKVRVRN